MGIEPTRSAWKAEVLPLNYICIFAAIITATILIISFNTDFVKGFTITFLFFLVLPEFVSGTPFSHRAL